jgi:hypothetical protein
LSAEFSQWLVLSRPECSLCDEMQEELIGLFGDAAAAIRIQDITGDTELESQYGQRIPVLLIEGDFVCAYRLDMARLRGYLDTQSP